MFVTSTRGHSLWLTTIPPEFAKSVDKSSICAASLSRRSCCPLSPLRTRLEIARYASPKIAGVARSNPIISSPTNASQKFKRSSGDICGTLVIILFIASISCKSTARRTSREASNLTLSLPYAIAIRFAKRTTSWSDFFSWTSIFFALSTVTVGITTSPFFFLFFILS